MEYRVCMHVFHERERERERDSESEREKLLRTQVS